MEKEHNFCVVVVGKVEARYGLPLALGNVNEVLEEPLCGVGALRSRKNNSI